jgi:hypothetical protein
MGFYIASSKRTPNRGEACAYVLYFGPISNTEPDMTLCGTERFDHSIEFNTVIGRERVDLAY